MCYALSHRLYKNYKTAERRGASQEELDKLYSEFLEQYFLEQEEAEDNEMRYYHVSGFQHPALHVICNDGQQIVQEMEWGLIPHWTKSDEDAKKFQNMTLNARSETIFEKPSFRAAARHRRCLLIVDSFFEYHHYKGKKYPFRIKLRDGHDIILAGLWDEWVNKETGEIKRTFSIVTCVGNELLTKIHNNPKLKGPRMPVILTKEKAITWLKPINDEFDRKDVQAVMAPYPADELEAYAVPQLVGAAGVGDSPEAFEPFEYAELPPLDL